jgi:hypothetical protein
LVLDGTVSAGSDSLDDSGQIKTEITFLIDENKVEGSSQYYKIGTRDWVDTSNFFIGNSIGDLLTFRPGAFKPNGSINIKTGGLLEVNEANFTTTVNAPRITLNGVNIETTFAKKVDYVSKTEVDSIVANAIIASDSGGSGITMVQAVETIKYLEGRIKVLEALMNQLGFESNMIMLRMALNTPSISTTTDTAFGF